MFETVLGAVDTVLWTVETTDCTGVGDPDPDPDPGAGAVGALTEPELWAGALAAAAGALCDGADAGGEL